MCQRIPCVPGAGTWPCSCDSAASPGAVPWGLGHSCTSLPVPAWPPQSLREAIPLFLLTPASPSEAEGRLHSSLIPRDRCAWRHPCCALPQPSCAEPGPWLGWASTRVPLAPSLAPGAVVAGAPQCSRAKSCSDGPERLGLDLEPSRCISAAPRVGSSAALD